MTVQDLIGIAIPSVIHGYVQCMLSSLIPTMLMWYLVQYNYETLISRSLLQAFSIIYFFVGSHPGLPASQSSSKEKSENNIVGLEVNSINEFTEDTERDGWTRGSVSSSSPTNRIVMNS
jgi:hypothetical protein